MIRCPFFGSRLEPRPAGGVLIPTGGTDCGLIVSAACIMHAMADAPVWAECRRNPLNNGTAAALPPGKTARDYRNAHPPKPPGFVLTVIQGGARA